MNVMCEVSFRQSRDMTIFSLWIEVWMPTAMPFGTGLALPAPASHGRPLWAEITGYTVADDVVVCEAKTTTYWARSHMDDFLAIGYRESCSGFNQACAKMLVKESPT